MREQIDRSVIAFFNTPEEVHLDFVTLPEGQAIEELLQVAGSLQGVPGVRKGQWYSKQTLGGAQEVNDPLQGQIKVLAFFILLIT